MEAGAANRETGSVEPFGDRDDRALSLEIKDARFMSGLLGPALAFFTGGLDRSTARPPGSLESPEVFGFHRQAITNGGCKRDHNGGFERRCDRKVEDDAALFSQIDGVLADFSGR
jgi:hypothetical protein